MNSVQELVESISGLPVVPLRPSEQRRYRDLFACAPVESRRALCLCHTCYANTESVILGCTETEDRDWILVKTVRKHWQQQAGSPNPSVAASAKAALAQPDPEYIRLVGPYGYGTLIEARLRGLAAAAAAASPARGDSQVAPEQQRQQQAQPQPQAEQHSGSQAQPQSEQSPSASHAAEESDAEQGERTVRMLTVQTVDRQRHTAMPGTG